mgnify:CR=1 FL=1
MEYRLCPSILSADFNRLGEQIKILEKEGVDICILMLWMEILFPAFLLECR